LQSVQDTFGHKAAANRIGRVAYGFNARETESPVRGTHRDHRSRGGEVTLPRAG